MSATGTAALPETKYRFITIRQRSHLNETGETYNDHPVYGIYNNRSKAQIGLLSFYRPWKQYVFSSQPECVFNAACLRDVLDFLAKTAIVLALLLFLPALSFAQSPARTVYCLKGDGTSLRIQSDGHYAYATQTNQYTGKASVERDGDLLVFGMPVFGHVNLKTHQASFHVLLRTDDKCEAFVDDVMTTDDATVCSGLSPEPVKAGLQIGQDGCKTEPSLKRPDSFRSGVHYDWSFARDARFYAGVGFSFAVTGYDISTSHGQEATRFYRNDRGELNKGKYWLVTGAVNAGFLPLDLMPDHRWRWASLGGRVGLALVRWNVARRNR